MWSVELLLQSHLRRDFLTDEAGRALPHSVSAMVEANNCGRHGGLICETMWQRILSFWMSLYSMKRWVGAIEHKVLLG